jgi:hypothetical protein
MSVKKTGEKINDKLYIEWKEETYKEYKIHFPASENDNNAGSQCGVTVIVDHNTLKELNRKIDRLLAWTCPKCGHGLHNYRRHECACDIKVCNYCGWDDS